MVEDNLSAHKLAVLYQILPAEQARQIINRIEIVRTPKHGSWLNIAEAELSVLARQGLQKRVDSKLELEKQIKAWYEQRNDNNAKVNWTFTTKDARVKLKKLYPNL